MIGVRRLFVSMLFDFEPIEVGELVLDGGNIHFKFYPHFLERNISISPIKLPNDNGIQTAGPVPFDGLFGVFDDSLPDGWGRLLLDRKLAEKQIPLHEVSPLDRLAFVGQSGKGALVYAPAQEQEDGVQENNLYDLDLLAHEMDIVIEGAPSDILDELYLLGGSSGGARPKIQVGYHSATDRLVTDQDHLPDGYEHWIIKFPSSLDKKDVANIEYAYYLMAKEAGIEMAECKLFTGKSGQQYFGTKRFDRSGNHRLHMLSAAGLMHDDFRHSQMDYGHLMDGAFQLENHVEAYLKVLRLAAFNVFSHNRDDHSKNFSFLMDANGQWNLAPAYDLTFSYSSHGMHSTMVAGESKNPGVKHLLELAVVFSIKRPMEIIDQVKESINQWPTFARESGVSENSLNEISAATQRLISS